MKLRWIRVYMGKRIWRWVDGRNWVKRGVLFFGRGRCSCPVVWLDGCKVMMMNIGISSL